MLHQKVVTTETPQGKATQTEPTLVPRMDSNHTGMEGLSTEACPPAGDPQQVADPAQKAGLGRAPRLQCA